MLVFTTTAAVLALFTSLALAAPKPMPGTVSSGSSGIFARQEGCPDTPQCVYAQDGSNVQGVNYCINGAPQEAPCPFNLPCTQGAYGAYCGS